MRNRLRRRQTHDDLVSVRYAPREVETYEVGSRCDTASGVERVGDPRAGRGRHEPGPVDKTHHTHDKVGR